MGFPEDNVLVIFIIPYTKSKIPVITPCLKKKGILLMKKSMIRTIIGKA
jgi:hypothetical protein